jgi:hypothetical protein
MTKAASTPRVRAYRERRRLGVRCVKVPVSKTVIEALVRMGYLPEALQQDVSAIQEAVQTYVTDCSVHAVTAFQGRPCSLQRGFSVVVGRLRSGAHATSLRWLATTASESGRSPKWFNAPCQANDGIYLFTVVPRSAVVAHLSVSGSGSGLVISWKDVFDGFWAFRRQPNLGNTVPNEENVSWLPLVEICRGNGSRTAKAPGVQAINFRLRRERAIPRPRRER